MAIRCSWGTAPVAYARSNRLSPSSRMLAASLVATVSGDPTYCDPSATSAWNLFSVGRAQPRSADAASSVACQCGH